jgi:hypothetical protein
MATYGVELCWCLHGNVGRAVRLASCDDLLEGMLGSVTVQRLNVINTNGVHFNNVSGNHDLLGQNCGEHKPPDRTRTRKQPQAKPRALAITQRKP